MIEVKESCLYNSGHLAPMNINDTKQFHVFRDGVFVERFICEETAQEFADILRKKEEE